MARSRICRTSIRSASATGFASRADRSGSSWQRAAAAGVGAVAGDPCGASAGRDPDNRRPHRRRPLRGVGRVLRRVGRIPATGGTCGRAAGQPRRQRGGPSESCPDGPADKSHEAAAPDPDDLRARHAAGHAAPCRGHARHGRIGGTLADALQPYAADMAAFADKGSARLSRSLAGLWAAIFPMVLPPDTDDGLGIIVLNSNAETHFSFTNALGLVSAEQARASQDCHQTISARLLDRGSAPSCHRIPAAGKGVVGAHRDGADQRQLVHPSAAASRPTAP